MVGDTEKKNIILLLLAFSYSNSDLDSLINEKKYLEIIEVVKPENNNDNSEEIFTSNGISINSDIINGQTTEKSKEIIISFLEKNNCGKKYTNYKLKT